MPPSSPLALAPRGSPSGGSSDDSPPPASIPTRLAEALERVAASLAELVATLRAHDATSSERHEAILREVDHLRGAIDELRLGPTHLAEARRRADQEVSLARVRTEADAAAAQVIAEVREKLAQAEAHAQALEAKLSAEKARRSAARALWEVVRDVARTAAKWVSSPGGAALVASVATALGGWILHQLGVPP